jgi:hypothetical protein
MLSAIVFFCKMPDHFRPRLGASELERQQYRGTRLMFVMVFTEMKQAGRIETGKRPIKMAACLRQYPDARSHASSVHSS